MTVCIAALCDSGETAILIADKRLGMEYVEADLAFKMTWLSPTWRLLRAGNDFSASSEIATLAGASLVGPTKKMGDIPAIIVQDALAKAYQRVRMRRIETRYLKTRGWTLTEFKEKGRDRLPASVYAEIDTAMKEFDLEVDLLACGFDGKYADLVKVKNPGEATLESDTDFEAIGVGDTLALASLYHRSYGAELQLREAFFYVYEAKVAAEGASSVGEPSDVVIMKRRGRGLVERLLSDQEQGKVRAICEKLKPKNLSVEDLGIMTSVMRRAPIFSRRPPKLPKPSEPPTKP